MKPQTSVDRAELERIATAALEAIAAKDADALVNLVPPDERADAGPDLAPGGRAHEIFFTETAWRHQAAKNWAGDFSEARWREGDGGARARLVIGEHEGKPISVELAARGGSWHFKDLRKRDVSRWGEPLESRGD